MERGDVAKAQEVRDVDRLEKPFKQSYCDEISLMENKKTSITICPSELNIDELVNKLNDPVNDGFLNGFTINDNEGIKCNNKDIVQKQSGIIMEIVKQLAKNMKNGITSLSLPIYMFEPKSQLERNVEWWSFAPIILKKAGKEQDPIESLKLATTFVLSSLFLSTQQLKPFNPYLGETFQALFEDGSKIYLEHTCHTPCISHYLIKDIDDDYTLSGFIELETDGALKMVLNNSVTIMNKGKCNVNLKATNRTLSIQYPSLCLAGLVMGQRVISWKHFIKVEDRTNNLISLVYLNKSVSTLKKKRVHDFCGGIYSCDFTKFKSADFYEEKLHKEYDSKYKLISFDGSYLEEMFINGKPYYDFRTNSPCQFYPFTPPSSISKESSSTSSELTNRMLVLSKTLENQIILPSDSRYREDLIWLKRAFSLSEMYTTYSDLSGHWKLIMEAQQRIDRENKKLIKDSEEGKTGKDEKEKKKGFFNSLLKTKK